MNIDFVVSHNYEASEAAEELADTIEALGHSTWLDVKAFYVPIQRAEHQIERAFELARIVCLFVNDDYRDSAWCQAEYRLALRSEEDLEIARVITVYESDRAQARIPPELRAHPSFPFTPDGIQRIGEFISTVPDHSDKLVEWKARESAERTGLLRHLKDEERLKLIAQHIRYLTKMFQKGEFLLRDAKYAQRIEIVGLAPSGVSQHMSPSLTIEMVWRWVSEILSGSSAVMRHRIDDVNAPLSVSQETREVLSHLPSLLGSYLNTSFTLYGVDGLSKLEFDSYWNYVLTGICGIRLRAGVSVDQAFDDTDETLVLFATKNPRLKIVVDYVRSNMPEIALPKNRYSSLRRKLWLLLEEV